MWVSGSLIRSSTWRSSSVSAPCISSSICLPSSCAEVAHDARQLLPGIADRLHARLHDAFLQLGGDVGEPLQRRLEFGILVPAHDLEQLVAREHQLGDHRHQLFERVDGDADRLAADLAGSRLFGLAADGLRLRGAAARPAVARKARSRSSSESSPGSAERSSTCGRVPTDVLGAGSPRRCSHHALELGDQVRRRRRPARAARARARPEFP